MVDLMEVSYRVIFENGSYGLRGSCVKEGLEVCEEILDISPNSEVVHKMAEVFEEQQLSLIHFRDVVEDMLE
jgi:hypothetical protein